MDAEQQTFYEFQEARNVLQYALEDFWKKVENDNRALIDEFDELLIETAGWNDLAIVEK